MVDLLQLLILLSITGICGAFAVLTVGFSPRGVMPQLFSLIVGTIGAAIGAWINARLPLLEIFMIKVGTIQINIILTWLCSLAVVGLLMILQWFLIRQEQNTQQPRPQP